MNGWIEVQAFYQSDLANIYETVDEIGCEFIHHFNDEPWWPGRPVVRIKATTAQHRAIIDELGDSIASWFPITMRGDQLLYGEAHDDVMAFFEAASRAALTVPADQHAKLVHCALNAWGYSVAGEARFHARGFWGRLRMLRHDLWYGKARPLAGCRYGCHPVVSS